MDTMKNLLQNRRVLIVFGVMLLFVILFAVAFVFQMMERSPTQTVVRLGGNPNLIDEYGSSPVDVEFVDGRNELNVARMANVELALPESKWFSIPSMQLIGFTLGLTDKATVRNEGNQTVWAEGNRILSIDPTVGVINFSTAFNVENVSVPDSSPTIEQLVTSFNKFLDQVKLPKDYLELTNLEYRFMIPDPDGNLNVSASGSGPLLISDLKYSLNGAAIVLPITSSVMIDSSGKIHNMTLYIPNLRSTGDFTNVLSIGEARRLMEEGAGEAIYLADPEERRIRVNSIIPAYYADNLLFHSLSKQRVLQSAYIFSGPEGKVIVLNKR